MTAPFTQKINEREKRLTANSRFAIGGVSCSADTFLVNQKLVLRLNFCAKKPAHRQSANRYAAFYDDSANNKQTT